MHGLQMVHGDVKGVRMSRLRHLDICRSYSKANILINKHRQACLHDFGHSIITDVATHVAAGDSQESLISNDSLMSFTAGGTGRWMSPELLDPELFGIPESEGDRPTRQSDCYALGMVIYEVCFGVNKSVVADS
jgi:serine/threonine protein kinase